MIVLFAMLAWTMIGIIFFFVMLATIVELDLGRTVSTFTFSAVALWSANGVGWALYSKLFRFKSSGFFTTSSTS